MTTSARSLRHSCPQHFPTCLLNDTIAARLALPIAFFFVLFAGGCMPEGAGGGLLMGYDANVAVTTTSLPDATVGSPYNQSLQASSGIGQFRWLLVAGSLPPGMTLSQSGEVSGVPLLASGTSAFRVQVTNLLGSTATADLTLTVKVPTVSMPSYVALREGDSGTKTHSVTVTLSNPLLVVATVDYTITDGAGFTGAANGTDYSVSAMSGTLVFGQLQTSKTILIDVPGNKILNPKRRSFTVELTNPSPAEFAGGAASVSATVSIVDDEPGFDFNGDGIADVFMGSQEAQLGASGSMAAVSSYESKIFVFLGPIAPLAAGDILNDYEADIVITGAVNGGEFSVPANAGDFNGDGIHDLIVGARNDDGNGKVYLFCGSTSYTKGTPVALSAASDANMVVKGELAGDKFGVSVSSAGDFNNDGFDDVIVGANLAIAGATGNFMASGAAFLFWGDAAVGAGQPQKAIDLSTPPAEADLTIWSEAALDGENFGVHVAKAGDFNNDGFEDVIVCANSYDRPEAGGSATASYSASAVLLRAYPKTPAAR